MVKNVLDNQLKTMFTFSYPRKSTPHMKKTMMLVRW